MRRPSLHDYPFRERRDSSGDLCLHTRPWDAPPLEADLRIVFEPVADILDGLPFAGFKYWFEYEAPSLPVHRLVDRQTWEPGGGARPAHLLPQLDAPPSACAWSISTPSIRILAPI